MSISLLEEALANKNLDPGLRRDDSEKNFANALGEITLEIAPENLLDTAKILRDEPSLAFDQCMDVTGVDYLYYGLSEWETTKATGSGFERAVEKGAERERIIPWDKPRFAVVYHLLSLKHNWRLRLRVFPPQDTLMLPSLIDIWPSVNWYEREAFDMFGFLFSGHPDLRRIMTDYGFVGHPFRKDFPLSGHVEVRYDAAAKRVVYEPVDIKPRVLVPKVIRDREA